MNAAELIEFRDEVVRRFENREILGPIHSCSDTQAEPLIEIFSDIKRTDWVLSTWRSHWHALLHGVPRERVMAEILAGRSMQLHFPEYRFMTSSIMGGMLPIACGLAAAGERVWCFVGDMCASTGAFEDATQYAYGRNIDVRFVVEDNSLSTNSPTMSTWGQRHPRSSFIKSIHYSYDRTTEHCGTENYVSF